MKNCDVKLAGAFLQECGYKPKQGIQKKWYLNWDDIDRAATEVSGDGTVIRELVLKNGAYIIPAEGNAKTSSASHSLTTSEFGNGYVHTDSFTLLYRGADARALIQQLAAGAKVCTIVQKTDMGKHGELALEILGYESGMVLTEDNWNSKENSGATTITVATQEGEEESTGAKLLWTPNMLNIEEFVEHYQWVP